MRLRMKDKGSDRNGKQGEGAIEEPWGMNGQIYGEAFTQVRAQMVERFGI